MDLKLKLIPLEGNTVYILLLTNRLMKNNHVA